MTHPCPKCIETVKCDTISREGNHYGTCSRHGLVLLGSGYCANLTPNGGE